MQEFTHIWRWDKWPRTSWDQPNQESRKGQRCKLLCKASGPGPKNALVEFEDGARFVVTNAAVRFGMRRLKS